MSGKVMSAGTAASSLVARTMSGETGPWGTQGKCRHQGGVMENGQIVFSLAEGDDNQGAWLFLMG